MILYIDAIAQKNNLLNMFEPAIYILADECRSFNEVKIRQNLLSPRLRVYAKWHKLPCLILIAIIIIGIILYEFIASDSLH